MKRFLISIALLLVFPSSVLADVHVTSTGDSNVSVNESTSGQSTTCINGDCKTTGGGSHTKVCINGNCTETEGNYDYDNGKTSVHVSNSNQASSTKQNNNSIKITPSVDDEPDSEKEEMENATKSAKEIKSKIKNDIKHQRTFFGSLLEMLKKLLPFWK